MANSVIETINNNLQMDIESDINRLHLFKPIRCTEQQVKETTPINGAVYFTTDTQKIYIGLEDKTLQLYNNHNFFYANLKMPTNNSGNQPDPNVNFLLNDIEGEKIPVEQDLILNIADGCFYKVDTVIDNSVFKTTRLTIQGTGGGGGGSSDGPTGVPSLRISSTQGGEFPFRYFSAEAKTAIIDVKAFSSDATNILTQVECSFDADFRNIFYAEYGIEIPMEQVISINIADQIPKMSTVDDNLIYIRVIDKYGTDRDFYYTIKIAQIKLTTKVDPLFSVVDDNEDDIRYSCSITSTKGLTDRKIICQLYDKDGIIVPEWGSQLEYSLKDSDVSASIRLDKIFNVPHGDYTLKVWATCTISGTTITSNTLEHKILRYLSIRNKAIFSVLIPEQAEQYISVPVRYLLAYENSSDQYFLRIVVNKKPYTTQKISANQIGLYNLDFDNIGQYDIDLYIDELGIYQPFKLNVIKYTGILPTINLQDNDLVAYFTAKGRTNDAADKELWPDYKNSTYKAKLGSKFYYKNINGWLLDADQTPYLKVSQGANLIFNDYSFLDKYTEKYGMTFELDFKLSAITNYSEDKPLLECLSTNNNNDIQTGFKITGDKFLYYHSGEVIASIDLVAEKRLKIAYVIEAVNSGKNQMCFTYINGILSNAYAQPEIVRFGNSQKKAYLKADSTYGQIDIYNIRFYSKALTHQQVLNNYQADLSPLEYREEVYNDNDIYTDNVIDLEKIEANNYKIKIPYVKIIGGYKATKKFVSNSTEKQKLPEAKDDFRLVDIEVHYPTEEANPHFKGYQDFFLTTTYDDESLNVLNGFGETPNTGTIIYAQGTSSMGYPVKNLRAKFKGKGIKVRPDLPEVNLICFKADYMESSGSHNTGAGNLIDAIYDDTGMQTPAQEYYKNENIVTCIKGHPCVIFWSKTGTPGTFEYIGKYNLNLDKATPEPFGFKSDDVIDANGDMFGHLKIEDTFFDESMNYNEDGDYNFTSCDRNSAVEKTVVSDEIENLDENMIKRKDTNSIFCFEFLDNNEQVCNFLQRSYTVKESDGTEKIVTLDFDTTWYGTWNGKPGWRAGFESRYPEDKEGYHDADSLYELASWIHELYTLYKDENTRDQALQYFKNEYESYFNKEFLLAYYIITEALLMADSRVKNMMLATWGREERTYTDRNGQKQTSNNFIWYPIFYDMDTMLGLDNIGKIGLKNYWGEDTNEELFNGDEVLWKMVRDALGEELNKTYNDFEKVKLTLEGILPYFNNNQATMANETFYNEDAMYKYILPYRAGFTIDDKTAAELGIEPGDRLYAAQGSRDLMREWFIYNRLRYLRGKRNSNNFQKKDIIEFRITYPTENSYANDDPEINRLIKASIADDVVPPSGNFDLTTMSIGYAGVVVGANISTAKEKFEANDTKILNVNTSSANGTELYINGASILSDLGDLSDKYLYGFDSTKVGSSGLEDTASADNNIKRLKLGNTHKDYYNHYWSLDSTLNFKPFKYLEIFDFMNNKAFTGSITLSNCNRLTNINLAGSNTTSVSLPEGGVINELRLPDTIKILNIVSHEYLTDNFSIGPLEYNDDSDPRKYTYTNNYSNLSEINLIDTPISNSYDLVKGALRINDNEESSLLERLTVQGFEWTITDINDITTTAGKLSGIKILDVIKERMLTDKDLIAFDPTDDIKEAIKGTITIDIKDIEVDEYEIYQLYNSAYPNISINYTTDNITKAYRIDFYSSDESTNGLPYYSALTNGEKRLSELTVASGPAGKDLLTPGKSPSLRETYSFWKWKIAASEDPRFPIGRFIEVNQDENGNYIANDFKEDIIFKGNIGIIAQYETRVRKYNIKLYDDNSTLLFDSHDFDCDLAYEDDIGVKLKDLWQISYSYKEYDGGLEHYRYTFKGWSSSHDFSQKPAKLTYSSLVGVKITSDFVAYAYYELEDARKKPLDSKYFTFETVSISINKGVTFNKTYGPGIKININPLYRDCLQGKITLPNSYDNQNIMFIGNFNHLPLVEEVYLLDGNKYIGCDGSFGTNIQNRLKAVYLQNATELEFINTCSFANCNQLESIDISGSGRLGEKLRFIGYGAFSANSPLSSNLPAVPSGTASELTSTDYYMKVYINGLPESLEDIQGHAFNSNVSMNSNVHINKLPDKLQIINEYTFRNCPNVKILDFGGPSSRLMAIKQAAFQNAGEGVVSINIYAPVQTLGVKNEPNSFIEAGAFSNYPVNGGLKYLNSYQPITSFVSIAGSPIQSWSDVGIANIDNITISEMT